jgi:ribosomal protein S18 acetylase RimI-like enzyme
LTAAGPPVEVPTPLVARAASSGDAEVVLDLLVRADVADTGEPGTDLDDVRAIWRLPGLDLERDAVVVVDPDGHAVAYAWVLGGHEGDLTVDPGWRGKGIGAALLDWLLGRARDQAGRSVRLQLEAVHGNPAALRLLGGAGFRQTRMTLLMGIDLDGPVPAPDWPPGVAPRSFDVEQDARAVHALIATAFTDVEGTTPRSFETWAQIVIERERFDPSLVVLVEAGGRTAGVAVNYRFRDEGFVQYLAVDRAWRGRGLGLALLRASFGAFARQGVPRATLMVDAENSTGAARLYERAGMRALIRWDRWELPLR